MIDLLHCLDALKRRPIAVTLVFLMALNLPPAWPQLMDGTYFVSKSDLLHFINTTLGLNLQKIEQVRHPPLPLSALKFGPGDAWRHAKQVCAAVDLQRVAEHAG